MFLHNIWTVWSTAQINTLNTLTVCTYLTPNPQTWSYIWHGAIHDCLQGLRKTLCKKLLRWISLCVVCGVFSNSVHSNYDNNDYICQIRSRKCSSAKANKDILKCSRPLGIIGSCCPAQQTAFSTPSSEAATIQCLPPAFLSLFLHLTLSSVYKWELNCILFVMAES